jgi:ABC-type branched-subunit amino acid transport system permease subunit
LFGLASELLWGALLDYHMLILGALIVVITLLFPKGISDLFAQFRSRLAGPVEKGGNR